MRIKLAAVFLSLIIVVSTAPFTLAEMGMAPLGTLTSGGNVTVGTTAATSGTTIFAGDRVASSQPALIDLGNGSRIELTRADATFDREGNILVIRADEGLLRFHFNENQNVIIDAGAYRLTSEKSSVNSGEIGLNRNGQMVVEVRQGALKALNRDTGEIVRALPGHPLILTQSGEGFVTQNGSSLTDASKMFKINELKGMCVVGGSEAYPIVGNSDSMITIKGAWQLNSGYHKYTVTECTKEAMMNAGATESAAAAAAKGATTVGASTFPTTAVAVVGVAAGAGVGIGVWQATKSPSSR
jgi:hypothetical protein